MGSLTMGSVQTANVPVLDFDTLCNVNTTTVTHVSTDHWFADAQLTLNDPATQDTTAVFFSRRMPSCATNLIGYVEIWDYNYDLADPVESTDWIGVDMQFSVSSQFCQDNIDYSCPLAGGSACQDYNGTQMCSAQTCVDLDVDVPIDEPLVSTTFTNDPSLTNSDGSCNGQVMLFTGRSMRCRKSGTQTAWQNCCNSQSNEISDSTGSSTDMESAVTDAALGYTYTLASSAYGAFAGSGTFVLPPADPYTVAISVAIGVAMDYLSNSCDQMDIETSTLKGAEQCVYVGTYCKEKWKFVGCVQKADTYCCFNTKMGRIIHEQGRPQLKSFQPSIWGSVGAPNCRGFYPEEFQALDFAKIDMSEYYDDLKTASQITINNNFNQKVQDFATKLP